MLFVNYAKYKMEKTDKWALGVSIHQAAAFAIARRGMRLKERVKVNLATPGLSVRNDLGDCNWVKAQKLIQQEKVRPKTRKTRIKISEKLANLESLEISLLAS